MGYGFLLWCSLSLTRLKLAAILACQILVTDPWSIIATFELPLAYGLLWRVAGRGYLNLTILYAALILFRLIWRVNTCIEIEKAEVPQSYSLNLHRPLSDLIRTIARELRKRPPDTVFFTLSPVAWRPYAISSTELRKASTGPTVIPLGCLEIYSVFDLKCELAHSFVRPRSTLLVPACERNGLDLARFARPPAFRNRPGWQTWAISKTEHLIHQNLAQWNLVADLYADRKVGSKYGAFAVSTWIQRSELAKLSVPICISEDIADLARDGILLPVGAACRTFHSRLEPTWLDELRGQMTQAERNPERVTALVARLGSLQHGLQNAGGADPRPASTLFSLLPSIEESAVRNELEIPRDAVLKRPAPNHYAEDVIIPLMRSELDRNSRLIADWKLTDLPTLTTVASGLALSYRTRPGLLLTPEQRKALIPGLLVSFLTIRLLDSGWTISYGEESGLELSSAERTLRPHALISSIMKRDITEEVFLHLVA